MSSIEDEIERIAKEINEAFSAIAAAFLPILEIFQENITVFARERLYEDYKSIIKVNCFDDLIFSIIWKLPESLILKYWNWRVEKELKE